MDDSEIPERERHQIEQIRQLESEVLQIEEVEDGHDSSDAEDNNTNGYGGASTSGGTITFDTSLASLHTYLGEVEDTHHRLTFLNGGAIISLPLFYLDGIVLFPEATLPLRVIQPNFIASVERALSQADADDPHTIGVVRVYRERDTGVLRFSKIGTTAEIRQFKRLDDGSVNVLTRGKQRFRLIRRWIDVEGSPQGEVQIIQEDSPLRTPRDAVGQLKPLKNLRAPPLNASSGKQLGSGHDDSDAMSEESFESELSPVERILHHSVVSSYGHSRNDESTSSDAEKFVVDSDFKFDKTPINRSIGSSHQKGDKKRGGDGLEMGEGLIRGKQSCTRVFLSRFQEAPRAFWPKWAYQMFDSYCLAQKAADKWKQVVGTPNMDGLVKSPDLLSFFIASKIPLSDSTKQELLEIDGISYRLRREIELLENFDSIRCKKCQNVIGKRSDMLVMSTDGPLGAYVNPHGYVHEILTLYRASNVALIGGPQLEYSWFPGYSWTIVDCASCENQMGWLFRATRPKLKPRSFWGIRCSVVADDMS